MVPSYFCPMLLCDADRTESYRVAIAAAMADFRRLNGRAPDVLDLGCGTGLLGLLAFQAGARTVVSVDLNEECIAMTRETVDAANAGAAWRVVHAEDLEDERFDMIVSEMLGTLCFGEQGFDAIAEHTPRLRDAVGGPYVIPRTATQTMALYAMPDAGGSWLRTALRDVLRSQVRWIGTNSLNLHPACLALEELAPAQMVYAADYVAGSEETLDATFEVPADAMLVGEWTATLWGDVRLSNTLEAYRGMPLANAVGRECAWGFVVAAPPPGSVTVRAVRNEYDDFVAEATMGEVWSVRDVKAADVSLGALLDPEVGARVGAALDKLGADREVLIETNDQLPMVRCLEAACEARGLPEPWHQDDVAAAWTMRNPILRTGVPVDEPAEGGKLALALLPDVLGECVTEAACRFNDDRFAPEKPTHVQVLEMVRSLGGDAATRTMPTEVPSAPEWLDVEVPVEGGAAMAVCLSAPLRRLGGYASLTRHGMLGDDYMPGNFMQALPLLAHGVSGKKEAVRLRMATPLSWRASPAPVRELAGVRTEVAALCVCGAAVAPAAPA